jgi:hypothetical protein
MKTLLKIFGWVLLGIVVIIGIALLYAYIVYPPEFVNREVRWRVADVYDYQKFPDMFLNTIQQSEIEKYPRCRPL